MSDTTRAPVAPCEIITADGTVLSASSPLTLAWKWAEHEHGASAWQGMTYGQQCAEVGAALAELNRAYGDAS